MAQLFRSRVTFLATPHMRRGFGHELGRLFFLNQSFSPVTGVLPRSDLGRRRKERNDQNRFLMWLPCRGICNDNCLRHCNATPVVDFALFVHPPIMLWFFWRQPPFPCSFFFANRRIGWPFFGVARNLPATTFYPCRSNVRTHDTAFA
jgi:hypothetical protein